MNSLEAHFISYYNSRKLEAVLARSLAPARWVGATLENFACARRSFFRLSSCALQLARAYCSKAHDPSSVKSRCHYDIQRTYGERMFSELKKQKERENHEKEEITQMMKSSGYILSYIHGENIRERAFNIFNHIISFNNADCKVYFILRNTYCRHFIIVNFKS